MEIFIRFIPGVIGGDGEEQDAYIIDDKNIPLKEIEGVVIAVIHRKDDMEEKWIVAKEGREYSADFLMK